MAIQKLDYPLQSILNMLSLLEQMPLPRIYHKLRFFPTFLSFAYNPPHEPNGLRYRNPFVRLPMKDQ